jgi:AraC-like DNA-binding protein
MTLATCLLTSNPNLTIGKVAKSCGFNDERYFSRCFKKFFGLSPKNYQQESILSK